MPIRRGEEYLESLRDGRRLWLITTHPALAGCARSVAAVYDLQHDVAYHELLTIPSPGTGKPVTAPGDRPTSVTSSLQSRNSSRHRGEAPRRYYLQGLSCLHAMIRHVWPTSPPSQPGKGQSATILGSTITSMNTSNRGMVSKFSNL